MNDAPSPSSSARLEARRSLDHAANTIRDVLRSRSNTLSHQDNDAAQATPSRSRAGSHINGRRRKRKNRKKRNPGLVRKLEFVTHLLKSLDTLVFAELSALYYME